VQLEANEGLIREKQKIEEKYRVVCQEIESKESRRGEGRGEGRV
jgi:hypothetical protein